MNYGTLNSLDGILTRLKEDAATVGFTIAGLMIVISAIMIMFTDDTNIATHSKRWDTIRKVFACAVVIGAAGAIISFGQQLGGGLHV